MFKKVLAAASAALISVSLLTGCGNAPIREDDKINVVCTVFPVYDWTRRVIGDNENVNITYLLGSGADIHSFQPTAADMITISDCDVFIYIGGESEEWVEGSLKNARNKDMTVIDLMDFLNSYVVEEEHKEGMAEEKHSREEETGYDEHIWLSLNHAERCVAEISRRLSGIDSENSAMYQDNATAYIGELQLLDRSFHMLFDNDPQVLIFADRFPFRYFTEDYGLDYYAAFSGCSSDTQASFETITFLAQKADELGCSTVFTIENSDSDIAEAVISNASSGDLGKAALNSIQSVSEKQIREDVTYLGIMKYNYQVLKEAFHE